MLVQLPIIHKKMDKQNLLTKSLHYYKNGVQFTSLNHYGNLKVK
jgi:hypothetical protein